MTRTHCQCVRRRRRRHHPQIMQISKVVNIIRNLVNTAVVEDKKTFIINFFFILLDICIVSYTHKNFFYCNQETFSSTLDAHIYPTKLFKYKNKVKN